MIYNLYINFKNEIKEHTLPAYNNRIYNIDISLMSGVEGCFISLEIIDDIWYIVKNEYVLLREAEKAERCELSEGKTVQLLLAGLKTLFAVTAQPVSKNLCCFKKYKLADKITIGSSRDSDICLHNELVSRNHALIIHRADGWYIEDFSTNGVYINSTRIKNDRRLDFSDIIYIFGTKIVFLSNIIAVNNFENTEIFLTAADSEQYVSEENAAFENEVRYQIRAECPKPLSHVISSYKHETADNSLHDNIYADLRASVVAGSISASAVLINNGSIDKILGISTVSAVLSGTVLLLLRKFIFSLKNKNLRQRQEERVRKYLELEGERISTAIAEYSSALEECFKNTAELTEKYLTENILFKSINKDSKNFLKLRLSTGDIETGRFLKKEDNSDNPYFSMLSDSFRFIKNIPLYTDMRTERILFLKGEQSALSLIIQSALLFSPSDVNIFILADESYGEKYSYCRWLPHNFSSDMKERFTAFSDSDCKEVIFKLCRELSLREEKRKSGYTENFLPHYLVWVLSANAANDYALKRYYMDSEYELGVSFIFSENNKADEEQVENAEKTVRKLISNYQPDLYKTGVPETAGFFETLKTDNPEKYDILRNYKINRADEGIQACIGIGKEGKRFILDLHEKKHGPHGLVAGTTGSGKSEILNTILLSLAINYNPDEVSFVLIDYKGGGLSDTFRDIPHTAGIITNLDGSGDNSNNLTRRALISLKSEIRRRQKLFSANKINNIDAYMKLYRAGKAEEPLPHIVIICDEFAELKRENPEFISQLVSTSRVGRSLGFHLILATQKPSGVIDDEIRSNSRFKICLKVQDRADSMEMLHREEASAITVTGRAYVQIGNNEIFSEIQSGYAGRPFVPEKSAKHPYIFGFYDINNQISGLTEKSEAEIIIKRIKEVCSHADINHTVRLWQEPLKEKINVSEIFYEGDGLNIVFGLADNPENRCVQAAVFNLYNSSNILIAGRAESGKTTMAATMLYSLAEKYSPERVKFQIYSFSGAGYELYKILPHCQGVYSDISDNEIKNFFESIFREIERRKIIFSDEYISDFEEYCETNNDIPAELICFDGYLIFHELFPDMEDKFFRLVSDGSRYGIYVIATVRQLSDMKFRIRQGFKTAVSLKLSDRTEYTEIFGIRPDFDISDNAGRGYIKTDGKILELQTAVCSSFTGKEGKKYLEEKFTAIREKWKNDISEKIVPYCISVDYNQISETVDEISEEIYFWSADERNLNKSCCTVYCGINGLYDLLVRLRAEFTERNNKKKQLKNCSLNNLIVVIESLDELCRCIYEEKFCEDMSSITETFFRGGSGLGITFVAGANNESVFRNREAYKIFLSYKNR